MLGIGTKTGPDCAFNGGTDGCPLCAPWSIGDGCASATEDTALPTNTNAARRRHCNVKLMKAPREFASAIAAR
jgi:hypothetical protein